jgi:hypothetical protein
MMDSAHVADCKSSSGRKVFIGDPGLPASDTVTVVSDEGVEFVVPLAVAMQSETIRRMLGSEFKERKK